MVFLLVTITVPAAFWWYLFRTDEIEFHWAVIWWGVSVVALAAVLGNIDWTLWRFEGREGYVKDIVETYTEAFGPGALLFVLGIGVGTGELIARASKEDSAQRSPAPGPGLPESALHQDAAGAAPQAIPRATKRSVTEPAPSASTSAAPRVRPALDRAAVAPPRPEVPRATAEDPGDAHLVDVPLPASPLDPLREQLVRAEARRAVAGSEVLTRKLEALLAHRDELLRRGGAPVPLTAREILAQVFGA